MNQIFNHLWQSTAFAAVVAITAWFLRRHSPRLRYWLWLTASLKFLLPFSLLVATGSRIQLPPDSPSLHAVTVQQISTYFAPVPIAPVAPTAHPFPWETILAVIWLGGTLFLLARWARNWHTIWRTAQAAVKLPISFPSPVYVSDATLEPGVFGVFRSVLLLPKGIETNLSTEQFETVLAHEARHIESRDNLTAALHMLVEALFWFHPLVWWIGTKLVEERERDCDEAVLRSGSRPGDYARSIVQVCQTYVESPLPCASGISGSDLKKRIREIMTWRGSRPVTKTGKLILASTAIAAILVPFGLGILRAQTLPPAPTLTYDAVSIHKSPPGGQNHLFQPGPQGGVRATDIPASGLIEWAYNVQDYQIVDAPGWASTQSYDISFTPDRSEAAINSSSSLKQIEGWRQRNMERMQAVLRDRFGLVLRSETRELPIYNLIQSKGGAKLTPHDPANPGHEMSSDGRQITGVDANMEMLSRMLASLLDRPVHNETHLDAEFDFKVVPDADGSMSESIFTALTEQLGLKLESAKGQVQVYVVEKIEHPSEN
jgi:uncharacterized protein (TIGR03435 family)